MKSVTREERLSSRLSLQWKQFLSREDSRRERNEWKKERGKKEEEEGEKEKDRGRGQTVGEGDKSTERRKFFSRRKKFRCNTDHARALEREREERHAPLLPILLATEKNSFARERERERERFTKEERRRRRERKKGRKKQEKERRMS